MAHIPDIETLNATASITAPSNNNNNNDDFNFLDEFLKSCGSATAAGEEEEEEEKEVEGRGNQETSAKNNTRILLNHSYNINPRMVISVGLNLSNNFVGTVKIISTTTASSVLVLLWDEWNELNQHFLTISSFFDKSANSPLYSQIPVCKTCGAKTKVPVPSHIKVTNDLNIVFVKKGKSKVVKLQKQNNSMQLCMNDFNKLVELKDLISLHLKRINQIQFPMFYNNLINTVVDKPTLNLSTVEYVNLILEKYVKCSTNIVYENLEAMYEILTFYAFKLDEDVNEMKTKIKRHGGKRIKMY